MAGRMVECPKCGSQNDASAQTCAACGLGLPWALEHWGEYVSGPAEGHPLLILCSDDEAGMLGLLGAMFQHTGYRVALSQDPIETMELADRLRPDLITTDIMKPDMDGFELIRRLKANPAVRHIPVLVVSARADGSALRMAKTLGAAGYHCKPILYGQLLAAVRIVLAGGTAFQDDSPHAA